jgi:hypothetical protein
VLEMGCRWYVEKSGTQSLSISGFKKMLGLTGWLQIVWYVGTFVAWFRVSLLTLRKSVCAHMGSRKIRTAFASRSAGEQR